ncbi:MAG TPA: aldo/keto reductase [Flavobacteriales bacterium]
MEYRELGTSGLKVPVLSFGTATFGGEGDFFSAWGDTNVNQAKRLINICLDAGLNFFDTANVYSRGLSEEILGEVIKDFRSKVIISTKGTFPMSDDPKDFGSSRVQITRFCDESLKRLKTDYIDVYHLHGFDANTPVDETLHALDDLIKAGKIRFIACSNFSGWHLMKSLSVSERHGWAKYVAHQVYYSLLNRDFEWELMPLAKDQNIGTIVWSPLSSGKLSGKFRRNSTHPVDSRITKGGSPIPEEVMPDERLFRIVDVLDEIASETNKTVSQVAINWLLQRPTISSIIIGARTEEQLKQNLGAIGWNLTLDQVKRLDAASEVTPPYPYWHQNRFPMLNAKVNLYE